MHTKETLNSCLSLIQTACVITHFKLKYIIQETDGSVENIYRICKLLEKFDLYFKVLVLSHWIKYMTIAQA